MKFTVYYRLFYGIDAVINFNSLEAMQKEIKLHKPEDFDYINACVIDEDGNEEIAYTGVKEILNAV